MWLVNPRLAALVASCALTLALALALSVLVDLSNGTRSRKAVAAKLDHMESAAAVEAACARRQAAEQRRFNVVCKYLALAGIGLAVYGIWEILT
jgi:hypothetical protein